MSLHIPGLYIAESPSKGRGVFTAEPLEPGDVIEICPVIVLPDHDLERIHQTALHDYYFLWGEHRSACAIALGYGSLYNHNDNPNAEIELDYADDTIVFICVKPILPGEEITIHYHSDPEFGGRLWF
ncbi:MAG: SET domain-containing protein-lysine N-methyltransferase [Saprospiraceae bacterium]|nr:SET domain-containing protein-lysine N-methyltransferase [Saprospiraceae bacterium]